MPAATDVRAHLVAGLEADLVGPFDPAVPHEVLKVPPSRWYLTGFLAPALARETKDPTSDDEIGGGDDEDDVEAGAAEPENKQKNLFPASMGLSVLLRPDGGAPSALGAPPPAPVVRATVSFAEYVVEEREPTPPKKKPERVWRRVPQGPTVVSIPLDAVAIDKGVAVTNAPGIVLKGQLKPVDARGLPPGTLALSLFVVNERAPAEEKKDADTQFIFQVRLALDYAPGLVPRPNRRGEHANDWDEQVADLQFRERIEWAVGHNASVLAPVEARDVTHVETTWLPHHEVRRVVTTDAKDVETSIDALAELPDAAAARVTLMPMVDAYRAWIAGQRAVTLDSDKRRATRDTLMKRADEACERVRAGIEVLGKDADVFEAFKLANRAMAMSARQRSPSSYVGVDQSGRPKVPRWRMFQLAFVLTNLSALADPLHPDRDTVDLIFFPTGGGKTEAYLGVIAVALLLRRIRGRGRAGGGLGVAVLLRYTLRLLTLDQLGRAATLVCALERIRQGAAGALGDERFAVGLWVGRSATANTLAEVREKITRYKNDTSDTADSGCPLVECPWCQHRLGRNSFSLQPAKAPEELVVGCLNAECAFNARSEPAGIPVVYVDEQVYRELPCFLIATVDKFAMLPWRGETGMLFGRATAREGRRFFGPLDGKAAKASTPLPQGLLPPELIVQDELHLISGPLGTMVGLYETAIEHLSVRAIDGKSVGPKIISSTATVRRAQEQIRALFGRPNVALFPPRGVDDGDTFFAAVKNDESGRLYVGVAAPGRSLKAILLRSYVDLLAGGQKQFDPKAGADAAADPYMTLVGYFNSLRELGGMRRLVEDDVRTRCRGIDERAPLDRGTPSPWFAKREVQGIPDELTSRERTSAIAASKARLAKPHVDADHVDVLLASNMISVGVDIDRLGLMVVAGQPKTTSEYIQATSRVGRKHPGLVVTCFNVRKPRDRSHFERFAAYHASFYRFVEAQSLTPFSGPALDRGLAGTLIAMTRLADPRATPPAAAEQLAITKPIGDAAAEALAARSKRQPSVKQTKRYEALAQDVRARAKNILDAWDTIVREVKSEAGGKIDYSPYDRERYASVHMLHTVLDDPSLRLGPKYEKFRAPTSMRDVEASVHLWIAPGRSLGSKG
jgi:hypothetical protein